MKPGKERKFSAWGKFMRLVGLAEESRGAVREYQKGG